MVAHHLASAARELVQKRIEHISRPIAVREQLAARLFVQRHPDVAEKRHRLGDGESPEDRTDDGGTAATEVGFADDGVGDVASRAAAHEDLRARTSCAVEERKPDTGLLLKCEDGCGKSGGSGADNGDVDLSWRNVSRRYRGQTWV